jgi:hypothetical protein
MPDQTRIVSPGPGARCVRTASGEVLHAPADWVLVPPGDAALTRRVKAAGPTWTVQEKRGRQTFGRGLWAATATVEAVRSALALERATPGHARKRAADAQRRARRQADYVQEFHAAVRAFLAFAPCHDELARRLAEAVTSHATPVGSGTVARTQRIPLARRAESAVIAWLRHQTTAYERLTIPRVKGQRRAVRRQLAEQSRQLLHSYRTGQAVDAATCPLQQALGRR